MEKWAKVFDIKGKQLLVTKDFDEDGTVGSGKINFEARINGSRGETSITTNNVEKTFNQITRRYAQTIFNELIESSKLFSERNANS